MATIPLAYGEDGRRQDRKEQAANEELRRTVKEDREAARHAHEQELVKQREADANRFKGMEKSKERYRQVLREREAAKTRSPQEQAQVREQRRVEASAKSGKQKGK